MLRHFLTPRFVRFAAVGFSGVFINLGALALLSDLLGLHDVVSSAAAIEISILWNFLLNNAWTFRDRNALAGASFAVRMARYNLVSLVGLAIQLGTFVVLTTIVCRALDRAEAGLYKYPAQLAGIGIAMAWNFFSNFFWTWAQRAEDG